MFEILTQRFGAVFSRLSRRGRLDPKDVEDALRQVKTALLEADVNLKVVENFILRVRKRALDEKVLESLTPAEQVLKIVYEELIALLGQGGEITPSPTPPSIIMLVGLHGSGKTTTAAKLALKFKREGNSSLLVAADPYRPAAIEQLQQLSSNLNLPFYGERLPPVQLCKQAVIRGKKLGVSWIIIDTAGRMHIDQDLMMELKEIKNSINPQETILVIDALTGQDGVRIAEEFHQNIGLSGAIITKLDGDARGGVALSLREVTGVPIKFIGVGERLDDLEQFHPDRIASRIMGMGDLATLVEKAERAIEKERAEELEKKLRQGKFDLEDFLSQIREIRKLGPIAQILEMIPGFSHLAPQLSLYGERNLKRMEAIILSMTPQERRNPQIIDGSRKRRIAKGSGTSVAEVNQLLIGFSHAQKLFKELSRGKLRRFWLPL